jgi:meso-butanediol dehydrogenase/(S,S)-butanediol dehydrogenase/diacetyl reductase
MSKMRFEGQVAIVTGGSMGIGRSTVLQLAAEGAHVVSSCCELCSPQAKTG